MSEFIVNASIKCQGGQLLKLSHESKFTKTSMDVNIYLPSQYSTDSKLPVVLYLSGLTCTPNNASEKSGLQYWANKHGLALVFPDTSPRGAGVAGEEDSWDFGTGAGFYVDSINAPWDENYNMYSYIMRELLEDVELTYSGLNINNMSIMGHSMGGFGAIMMYLKNPDKFKSCSAFAPICNPSVVPWGVKCFGNYLGENKTHWELYDPCHLIKHSKASNPILIHVGSKDSFKDDQLKPANLVEASKGTQLENKIQLLEVDGYDHSYYFISSFVEDHINFHVKYLK